MASVRKYKNMFVETDEKNVAFLYLDKENASVNVLSAEVLTEFDLCLDYIENTKPEALIILSAKKSGFIAGADVNEFVPIKDEVSALALIKRGQAVFNRLEKLPFPTVAAINGFCLGGGMELALACRYRVAQDDENTMLGLPEVKLGIHPGFGGTVRSVRLMGGLAAMDIMLTGRTLKAKAAKKTGLVDMTALADNPLLRPFAAIAMGKKLAEKANPRHYPAPYALMDLWRNFSGDWDRMMDEEAKSVSHLIVGRPAQNLVRIFLLQEKMKAAGKKSDAKAGHVHVIGAGIMGGDIAAWCALRGLTVTLQDREAKLIAPAVKRAHGLFTKKLKDDRLVRAAMDRLMPDVGGHGAGKADVVIEAVFEDLNVKRELFKNLEARVRPQAILATNTSSIPLEEIAPALSRPDRLVGIHFFNPVPLMQLVEVVRGASTSQDVFDRSLAFVNQIGKLPLGVKSSPGFLVNRILMPYLLEGVIMESEGIPIQAIDKAATDFGMPMGPILLADTVGLDICYHVAKIFSGHMTTEMPDRLEKLVKAGNLGKKSGSGFYQYRNGKQVLPPGGASATDETVANRLMLRYLNESVACLREGVVENADMLDAGMVFGTGFAPFLGGPMKYATDKGPADLVETLSGLEKKFGSRFRPDEGWKTLFK